MPIERMRSTNQFQAKSRPTQGIVTVCTRGLNQDRKEVMTFERTVLVHRRSHSPEEAAGY